MTPSIFIFQIPYMQHRVLINHKARQISTSDFTKFTYILASDESNLRNLERIKPSDSTADIRLWGSFLDNRPIPDPYYGGMVSHGHIIVNVCSLYDMAVRI
jgi:protein-tyrosine-phosphatase